MKSKILIAICYLFSAIISIVIIMHSYTYLIGVFTYSAFLIFSLVSLIEILYISVPYIATFSSLIRKYDKALVVLLFFLSVVPATLQTSESFYKDISDRIVVQPIKPEKPDIIGQYQNQIDDITRQIDKNQVIIITLIKDKFITKADRYRRQNTQLNLTKINLTQKSNALQVEYSKRKGEYNISKQKFDNVEKKQTINNFFDFLKLSWTLALISIFQLVNSRLAFHGTTVLMAIKEDILEDESINKNKDKPEPLKVLLTKEKLLEDFKASGVGPKTVNSFMQTFNLKTADDLRKFISENFEGMIEENFPHETAKNLKNFCRKIKRNTEEKNERLDNLPERETG